MTGEPAIVADRLTRDYRTRSGQRRALDDLSFSVHFGQIAGLLGPNGAGKTTCIRILTTLLLPTSGTALVAGIDVVAQPRRAQRILGASFGGDSGLYTRLSARDNLRYFGTMYGMSGRRLAATADRLLDRVSLTDRARDRVETFSRGMRQRLHIARALLADPRVLLLDEPSSGLDPASARDLRRLVTDLRDEGRAVLLTTHDMIEAEQLCEQVLIIDRGRLARGATVRALRAEVARSVGSLLEVETRLPIDATVLAAVPGLLRSEQDGDRVLRVFSREPAAAAGYLVDRAGDALVNISISAPSLEEAYLASTAAAAADR